MAMNELQDANVADRRHERIFKITAGYLGFVAALLVLVLAAGGDCHPRRLIEVAFALSIPSLAAYLLLDYSVRVAQRRKESAMRGLAMLLGYVPSFIAIVATLCHVSWLAGIVFFCAAVFWFLVVYGVTIGWPKADHLSGAVSRRKTATRGLQSLQPSLLYDVPEVWRVNGRIGEADGRRMPPHHGC